MHVCECSAPVCELRQQNNAHWILTVINFREKRTEVYDSWGGSHPEVHDILHKWLKDEHQDKLNLQLPDGWTRYSPGIQVPQQENANDCGVFTCMFAACVSLGESFDFRQTDIARIRQWMVQIMYQEGEKLGNCEHIGLCIKAGA